MAEMYPRAMSDSEIDDLIPRDGSVSGGIGENLLYRLMKKYLPNDWVVIWNKKLIDHGNENQYDFLVLVKGMGVLLLDAKGHNIGYNENGVLGRWGKGRVFSPDPQMFNDVKDSAEHLRRDCLIPSVGNFGACNCLIVFIDQFINNQGNVPQPDEKGWMDRIKERLENEPNCLRDRIVERLSASIHGVELTGFHHYFTPQMMGRVKELFCKRNGWEIYFQDDFYSWDCRSHEYLSSRQTVVFDRACEVEAMHVRGAAGTGKTILAMSLARHYARQSLDNDEESDKKVLYVCYNRNLMTHLQTQMRGWRNVELTTYDALGTVKLPSGRRTDAVLGYRQPNRIGWGDAQYKAERDRIRTLLDTPKALNLSEFDVVMVDEAQDLDNACIYSLLRFRRNGGKFFVFSDEGQAIYASDEWKFAKGIVFSGMQYDEMTLTENWRNTIQIHRHYRDLGCDQSEASFRGKIDPQIIARKDVSEKLKNILEQGRRPKNIALLSIAGSDMSEFKQVHKANGGVSGPMQIVDNINKWYKDECILKTSVEGFKGLEADIVFLFGDKERIDGTEHDKAKRTMDRYVGESRAKYELYIIED